MRIHQHRKRLFLPGPKLPLAAWLAWLTCFLAASVHAQTSTETVLHSFGTFPYGGNPYAPLLRDLAGDLYGTTNQGGEADLGVVFQLTAAGAYHVLYSFQGGADGANPYSGVISLAGTLYGTTYSGGPANAGEVYSINSAGQYEVLHSFTGGADGGNPYSGVIAGSDGNLYGTTYLGGNADAGVVYKLTPAGQETVLYSFTGGTDGGNPYAGVIEDPSGNLYGTTLAGGSAPLGYTGGVVYRLSPSGQETVLYSFDSENNNGHGPGPSLPYAGVIADGVGNLYGAAWTGGAPGGGEGGCIYKINAAGSFSVLYTFFLGPYPSVLQGGLVRDGEGNLYGTTENSKGGDFGIVYKLDTAGNATQLYTFPGAGDNSYRGLPNAGLTLDAEGNLYGTTPYGGMQGMVYKLDPTGQETTLYSFVPAPGGTNPTADVVRDRVGNLYGVTQLGGAANWGTVYKVDTAGHERALYSFTGGADGGSPRAGVVLDSVGNLYGTTFEGGSANGAAGFGVVFRIDRAGEYTVIHTFTGGADGGSPDGVVTNGTGYLYGTASYGVADGGVIFKMSLSGQETVLYNFTDGADGGGPNGVILDRQGNIYGTTYVGGTGGFGVVYKLDTSGKQTVLYSFPGGPEGALPSGSLYQDAAGNLYGTTTDGGGAVEEAGSGVVFKVDASGAYTVLYRFTGQADGGHPFWGVLGDAAGNLYGTTADGGTASCSGGCGVVYKLTAAGQETVLHSFTGGADGAGPYCALTADAAGNLYGTASNGGKGGFSGESGGGVVFKVVP